MFCTCVSLPVFGGFLVPSLGLGSGFSHASYGPAFASCGEVDWWSGLVELDDTLLIDPEVVTRDEESVFYPVDLDAIGPGQNPQGVSGSYSNPGMIEVRTPRREVQSPGCGDVLPGYVFSHDEPSNEVCQVTLPKHHLLEEPVMGWDPHVMFLLMFRTPYCDVEDFLFTRVVERQGHVMM